MRSELDLGFKFKNVVILNLIQDQAVKASASDGWVLNQVQDDKFGKFFL
jgi:hypothetical protein